MIQKQLLFRQLFYYGPKETNDECLFSSVQQTYPLQKKLHLKEGSFFYIASTDDCQLKTANYFYLKGDHGGTIVSIVRFIS